MTALYFQIDLSGRYNYPMKVRKILNDSSIVGPDSVFAAIIPFPQPEILMVSLVQIGWVLG